MRKCWRNAKSLSISNCIFRLLEIVVDKINIELNTFKSLKEATERSKKETEETLQELEKNESRLRALNAKTLEQLYEKRGT